MKRVKNRKEGGSFFGGVLLLSLSTVIVKLIGLFYKIPMMARLGAEGMGYFNAAYEVYAILCIIATAGLPVAMSMLISDAAAREEIGRIRRIERCAVWIFALFGLLGSALLFFGAAPLSAFMESGGAEAPLRAIAPALLFVCLSSAMRGYFQGFSQMAPTALSQLIEALGKLILGVIFAGVALSRGYDTASVAAYGVLGLTLGCGLSMLYLLLHRLFFHVPISRETLLATGREDVSKTLLRIAFPITLSAAVLGVTRLVDMVLILRRLQDIGYSESEASAVYGSYTTLALPLFSLVPALLTPIALSLVPHLSGAIAKEDKMGQGTLGTDAVRLTVLVGMPASMGLAVYAPAVLRLLFPAETEAIDVAAPLLSVLAPSVLFACLITTANAILQSYRKTLLPILSMSIGAILKMIGAYILIGIPEIGAMGAPISTLLCDFAISALNLAFLAKTEVGRLPFGKCFWRPLGASLLAMGGSLAVYLPLLRYSGSGILGLCGALITAPLLYLMCAFLLRAMEMEDIQRIPWIGARLDHRKKGKKHKSGNL